MGYINARTEASDLNEKTYCEENGNLSEIYLVLHYFLKYKCFAIVQAEALVLKTEVPYSMLLLPGRKLGFFGNKLPLFNHC